MTAQQSVQPVDVATDPHGRGVFAPVIAASDATDRRVFGDLPAEMDGSSLRNGPTRRFPPLGFYAYPPHRVRPVGNGPRVVRAVHHG